MASSRVRPSTHEEVLTILVPQVVEEVVEKPVIVKPNKKFVAQSEQNVVKMPAVNVPEVKTSTTPTTVVAAASNQVEIPIRVHVNVESQSTQKTEKKSYEKVKENASASSQTVPLPPVQEEDTWQEVKPRRRKQVISAEEEEHEEQEENDDDDELREYREPRNYNEEEGEEKHEKPFRVVPCRHFAVGHCRAGDDCTFKHSDCRDGDHCANKKCNYGHSKRWRYATREYDCKYYASGNCIHGDNCSYSHDD